MHGVEGKVVVITGGGSGIGEATAMHLGRMGATVVVAGRREGNVRRVAQHVILAGGIARAHRVDVTSLAQMEALTAGVLEEFGRIDVLVGNAGVMPVAPLTQRRVADWDSMIDVNIRGILHGIAAVLPVFEEQDEGHFINIGSVAGLEVFSPGATVYSGTKFAVRAISEGLRHEVGCSIRVTVIEPGAVTSELPSATIDPDSREALNRFYQDAIPPSAVARAVAFAIEQPDDVDVNEIVLRPTVQEF